MKVQTLVSLSEDLLADLDRRSQDAQDEDAGDLEIINSRSAELNEEADDVLEYQQDPLKALRGAGQREGLLDRLLQSRREDRERGAC